MELNSHYSTCNNFQKKLFAAAVTMSVAPVILTNKNNYFHLAVTALKKVDGLYYIQMPATTQFFITIGGADWNTCRFYCSERPGFRVPESKSANTTMILRDSKKHLHKSFHEIHSCVVSWKYMPCI